MTKKIFIISLLFISGYLLADNSAIFINEEGKVGINVDKSVDPVDNLEVNGGVTVQGALTLKPLAQTPINPSLGSTYLSDGNILYIYLNEWKEISFGETQPTAFSNLTAWYKLNETNGTLASDFSNNSNYGVLNGGLTFSGTAGKKGGALLFDGSDDEIDIPSSDSINFGTGDFTISAWFYRHENAQTNLRILSKGAGNNLASNAGFCFYGSNTSISFAVNPSGPRSTISSSHSGVNKWIHVTGVVERGGLQKLYIDGALVNSTAAPTGSVSGSIPLAIGSNQSLGQRWDGLIDDVRLYNRALSDSEILALQQEDI